MSFKGMSCFLVLLVGFLISTTEGLALDDVNTSHAVTSSDTSNSDDSSLKKKEEVGTGDVSIQGQPAIAGEDPKTFSFINHLLNKIPFFNKNKETTTTVTTTSNAVPNIPGSLSNVAGK